MEFSWIHWTEPSETELAPNHSWFEAKSATNAWWFDPSQRIDCTATDATAFVAFWRLERFMGRGFLNIHTWWGSCNSTCRHFFQVSSICVKFTHIYDDVYIYIYWILELYWIQTYNTGVISTKLWVCLVLRKEWRNEDMNTQSIQIFRVFLNLGVCLPACFGHANIPTFKPESLLKWYELGSYMGVS